MADGYTASWMWRDHLLKGLATKNPLRWSANQSIPDTLKELRGIQYHPDGGRPCKAQVKGGKAPTKIKADSVQELIQQLEAFVEELQGSGPPCFSLVEASEPERVECGAYLVYETDQHGALCIVWSRTAVPGALAFGNPQKDVPGFKFARDGKTTLRKTIMQDKTFYYAGWCMFLKSVKAFECQITDYGSDAAPLSVQLWLHYKDSNKVEKAVAGTPFTLPDDIDMIAATHRDNKDLEAASLSGGLFREKAVKALGYCINMNDPRKSQVEARPSLAASAAEEAAPAAEEAAPAAEEAAAS